LTSAAITDTKGTGCHAGGAPTKKLIILSLFIAVTLLGGALPAHAQNPATDLKPTFISPTPGLYVHGWPPFTVSYPKEWVEMSLSAGAILFLAGVPRPNLPPSRSLAISAVFPSPLPLEDWAKIYMPVLLQLSPDMKVLSDKPSQLKDGTPAREVELESKIDLAGRSIENPPKVNSLLLLTKKDVTWVSIFLNDDKGRIGEDLKKYAYSLTFQPDREKPVQVPPDVRAFLDMWCADVVSGDVKAIMAHFSDRFLFSGMNKVFVEQRLRNDPLTHPSQPIQMGVISQEATVTVFEPRGDKAYVDGFLLQKTKGDATALKAPMYYQQIINEHGQWKWYGNQK
jgi:hypothetical protein